MPTAPETFSTTLPDAAPTGSLRVRTLHLAPDCTIAAVQPGTEAPVAPSGACPREPGPVPPQEAEAPRAPGMPEGAAESAGSTATAENDAEPASPADMQANGAESARPAAIPSDGAESARPAVIWPGSAESTRPAAIPSDGAESTRPAAIPSDGAESTRPAVIWHDITTPSRSDLGRFLAPYDLPDDVTEACLAPRRYPEVSVFPSGIMVHLPTRHDWDSQHSRYLTVLCLPGRMITLHDEDIPLLDKLVQMIRSGNAPLQASVQALLIFLLDACIDANVHFYMEARTRVEQLAELLDETPDAASPDDILPLKRAITRLSIQFEDQFYCLATLQTLQATALPLTSQREGLRDIMDNQNHLARSQARLEMRLRDLYQFYLLLLQRNTDHRIRVLTVLTAVCMPLTVIAGIYGMNFRHMPELNWDYGYYVALGAMLAVAGGMMWFFHKRGWFR
ncbi:magnesium transporter CorA family protein [Nitratidesulfovibrio termitidis]|uniref:magnesium transporter CorA family protein n=1 Tax=Nitratidesulfovibrio termitidis TaxID=42252 RepID=UPI0004220D3C|nr:magnesium transporter CorA family protein [Nitratidesulfovibrio termitidis]